MVFTPDYTITLHDKTDVHFLFNDWALKDLCKKQGLELWQLQTRILKTVNPELETELKGLNDQDAEDIMLSGHKSWCLYNDIPFSAGEKEVSLWIDAIGGRLNGDFVPMFQSFFSRIFNVDPKNVAVETEKKSQEQATALHGGSSM